MNALINFAERTSLYYFLASTLCLSSCARPLFVTHWSAADRAFVKKKGYGYPSHNKLSVIVCFDELCLNKAEWKNKQKRRRFKGFKKKYEYHPGQHKSLYEEEVIASLKDVKEDTLEHIEINRVQRFENIHFSFGKAYLDKTSTGELDELLNFLTAHSNLKLKIMGHADDVGSEELNRELSFERAKSVTNYLVEKGLDKDRISYEGFGSNRPVVEGDSEIARSKNRRVEFLIY